MKNLTDFISDLHNRQLQETMELPLKREVKQFVDDIIDMLFPAIRPKTLHACHLQFYAVSIQLDRLLCVISDRMESAPVAIRESAFEQVPQIYMQLLADAEAIYRFDPAAGSIQEVVHAYPGFFAIATYRFAHMLHDLHVPVLPRMMSEYAHSVTGIDIHPGAKIGHAFFIDHGTGVVIGETTCIGDHVKIYQGVTLGALHVSKDLASSKRHPTIEDHVIIYAGSTVLGGSTVVGHDSVIGGNVWLTESVPPNSVVYHTSQIKIRNVNKGSAIDFCI